jgi:hypothetical protein
MIVGYKIFYGVLGTKHQINHIMIIIIFKQDRVKHKNTSMQEQVGGSNNLFLQL